MWYIRRDYNKFQKHDAGIRRQYASFIKNNKVLLTGSKALIGSSSVEPQDKTYSQVNPVVAGYLADVTYKSGVDAIVTVNEKID